MASYISRYSSPRTRSISMNSQILGILAQQLGMLATSLCGFPGALLLVWTVGDLLRAVPGHCLLPEL